MADAKASTFTTTTTVADADYYPVLQSSANKKVAGSDLAAYVLAKVNASTATDNALARFDGTTGLKIQNSGIIIDDSNNVTGMGTLASGNHTITGTEVITSASATAFAVGANGATNPALKVKADVASSVTGLEIESNVSGQSINLNAISSNSNAGINVSAKGNGTIALFGPVNMRPSGGIVHSWSATAYASSPSATTTASSVRFSWIAAADITLTASTEAPAVYFNLGATRQHATGAITLQRDYRITGSTHSFVAASTLTDAAALSIDGACIAGTNATLTRTHTIYSPGVNVGSGSAASYSLYMNPNSGATANYGAALFGLNGLGRDTPTAFADCAASTTASASLRIRSGTAPSSPNDGDIWFDGTDIKMRIGGATKTFTLI